MEMKGSYGGNFSLAKEFERRVSELLDEWYQRSADAVRSIHSALDAETVRLTEAFKPLQSHFGGLIEVERSFRGDVEIIDRDSTEHPSCQTEYAATVLRYIHDLRNLEGEIVGVRCKILEEENPDLIQRLEDIWIREDVQDLGVTTLTRSFDPKPNSDQPYPHNLLGRYSIPVITLWPAYGVAGFANTKVLDHQLISEEGISKATEILGKLEYRILAGIPLKEMQQKSSPPEAE